MSLPLPLPFHKGDWMLRLPCASQRETPSAPFSRLAFARPSPCLFDTGLYTLSHTALHAFRCLLCMYLSSRSPRNFLLNWTLNGLNFLRIFFELSLNFL